MQIITSIIPIFAVIFLGTTLRRFGLIDDSFVKTANRLIFYICLPVLLFHKISTASLNQTIRWLPIDIMLTAILSVSILAFLLAKAFHWPLKTGGTLAVNSFRGNFAYMALPVCYYTFGDQGLVIGSVFMGVLIPFVNTLAVISFTIGGTKRFRFQPILAGTGYGHYAGLPLRTGQLRHGGPDEWRPGTLHRHHHSQHNRFHLHLHLLAPHCRDMSRAAESACASASPEGEQ